MRLFVAVDVDKVLKPKITELQKKFHSPSIKLVEPENLHFTLKFLGEVHEKQMLEIAAKLESIAKNHQKFNLHISGLGTFPSETFVRVIWLGSNGLESLLKDVQDSLSHVRKEDYSPKAHLTIARVRSHNSEIPKLVKSTNAEIGNMKVSELTLKKSVLSRNDPVYEDLQRFELD